MYGSVRNCYRYEKVTDLFISTVLYILVHYMSNLGMNVTGPVDDRLWHLRQETVSPIYNIK